MSTATSNSMEVTVRLDKGVYMFVRCYAETMKISLSESVCELVRFFKFISGDEKGLEILRNMVSSSIKYHVPLLGSPVCIKVKLSDYELEYLRRISEILGLSIDESLKICLATLAKLLEKSFPYIRCRLKGLAYDKFRLADFKYMINRDKRSEVISGAIRRVYG